MTNSDFTPISCTDEHGEKKNYLIQSSELINLTETSAALDMEFVEVQELEKMYVSVIKRPFGKPVISALHFGKKGKPKYKWFTKLTESGYFIKPGRFKKRADHIDNILPMQDENVAAGPQDVLEVLSSELTRTYSRNIKRIGL